jgi:glycine cleavage system regulatory protein
MSLNRSLVFSLLTEDRPGVVERVSSLVASHQGNWMESHLSSRSGYFGGIVHVIVPLERAEALTSALEGLSSEKILIVVKSGPEGDLDAERRRVTLEVVGNDQPGIVSRISEAIADRGINMEELQTACISAPMSGTAMFQAHAKLYLPAEIQIHELQSHLEEIASDLMVDISLD